MSIRYIRTVRRNSAEGLVVAACDQIRPEFGILGEPLVVHSPIPELLAAVAPYQVDDQIVKAFRRVWPRDIEVLGAVSWGASRVAERIASWL
jgi:hypothetical protein